MIQSVNASIRQGLQVATPGRQPAIFVDRDGVINKFGADSPEEIQQRWIPGSLDALSRLSQKTGLPVIVVSNQPGAWRKVAKARVQATMQVLAQSVAACGGYLSAIYYCPHNGRCDSIKPGQVNARKPEAGMLLAAAHDFGQRIDLADSYIIGDSTGDMAAGKNAHPDLTTILVQTGHGGRDQKHPLQADMVVADLQAAADWILAREAT